MGSQVTWDVHYCTAKIFKLCSPVLMQGDCCVSVGWIPHTRCCYFPDFIESLSPYVLWAHQMLVSEKKVLSCSLHHIITSLPYWLPGQPWRHMCSCDYCCQCTRPDVESSFLSFSLSDFCLSTITQYRLTWRSHHIFEGFAFSLTGDISGYLFVSFSLWKDFCGSYCCPDFSF